VVLNACEGARSSSSDPFSGVAQSLIRGGVPAVIAMQFEITDTAAITFCQGLYSAIADGYPIDAALGESRKAIFASGNVVEWATPVLHMRSPDGHLFKLTKARAPAGPRVRAPAERTPAARAPEPGSEDEEPRRADPVTGGETARAQGPERGPSQSDGDHPVQEAARRAMEDAERQVRGEADGYFRRAAAGESGRMLVKELANSPLFNLYHVQAMTYLAPGPRASYRQQVADGRKKLMSDLVAYIAQLKAGPSMRPAGPVVGPAPGLGSQGRPAPTVTEGAT
jgi:hypothetical protein